MKIITALFFGLMLAVTPSALHAQVQNGAYKIDKITPTFVNTPEYQAGSMIHQEPNPAGKWLEVEVQFESKVDLTDELTIKYYVLINNILVTGDVTHVDVPKGRELYSVMYMSPRTLTRLLANRTATPDVIGDIGVQILVKGQAVAELSTKTGYAQGWWASMQQTAGLLVNKNQTPFAPLYWDRYEAIKPTDH